MPFFVRWVLLKEKEANGWKGRSRRGEPTEGRMRKTKRRKKKTEKKERGEEEKKKKETTQKNLRIQRKKKLHLKH